MKILLIHQYFLEKDGVGGTRFNEMTKIWGQQGHSVTVIGGMFHHLQGSKLDKYKGKYVHHEKDFYENVDVLRCTVSESYNVNFRGRMWAYFSFVFSSLFGGIFKLNSKFDVVIVSSPPLFVGVTGYLLSKWYNAPLVFEIRDLWPESAIDTGVLTNSKLISAAQRFERFIYSKAKRINVLTPAFKDNLLQKKNVPIEKIIQIPNAADFSMAEQLFGEFDVDEFRKKQNSLDKFVISYVGAHGVANHLIQLVDAAEKLTKKEVLIQLIGTGMQKDSLIEEVKKRGITNLKFIDPVPKYEVFKYILASDMGASVLKNVDTFKTIYSNKTFDYMSCKKAVLLLIDGVSKDLVESAKCGVFAQPENTEDIIEKIEWCVDNKDQVKRMGENGYLYAKKHFDRNHLAKKYLLELEQIV